MAGELNWSKRKDHYISGTGVKNYLLKDPILDYFNYHSDKIKDKPSSESLSLSTSTYLCNLGINFEKNISALLHMKFSNDIIRINNDDREGYTKENFEKTKLAIKNKIPIIEQGVLYNDKNGTCGMPDLIVRSDYLEKIVNFSHKLEKISGDNYYVIVDIKFTGIDLCSDGLTIRNKGRLPSYKAQLHIYNLALSEIQGYLPSKTYILAKSLTIGNEKRETFSQFGEIDYRNYDGWVDHETKLALEWLTDVISEGDKWDIYNPHRWELYPNMSNTYDDPWTKLKETIANSISEITKIWNVSFSNRILAMKSNVYNFRDENCNSKILGINQSSFNAKIIDKIISINRQGTRKIDIGNISMHFTPMKSNFYIDFETIDNDTFMIGIVSDVLGNPEYKVFVVDSLDIDNQKKIYLDMVNYVKENGFDTNNIYHWSYAEISYIKKMSVHVPELTFFLVDNNFIDLCEIFKKGIVIKDAFDFKLKNIVNALYKHNFLNVFWKEDGLHSGLDAMIQGLKYYTVEMDEESRVKILTDIIDYNRIDCLSLYSIYKFLLSHIE